MISLTKAKKKKKKKSIYNTNKSRINADCFAEANIYINEMIIQVNDSWLNVYDFVFDNINMD